MDLRSDRQRMVNPRKAYPVDTGLIPVFDRTGRADIRHALESAVLRELEQRRCETTYVRTPDGYEVDFLARGDDGAVELISTRSPAGWPLRAVVSYVPLQGPPEARAGRFSTPESPARGSCVSQPRLDHADGL